MRVVLEVTRVFDWPIAPSQNSRPPSNKLNVLGFCPVLDRVVYESCC